MGLSKLDIIYRKLILTKFYTRGWGRPDELKDILKMHKLISKRETCFNLVSPNHQVHIDDTVQLKQCTLVRGHFVTPLLDIVPQLIPSAAQIAKFEIVLPKGQTLSKNYDNSSCTPACIHMAGTGDHGFRRRRELLAKPLLKSGIISVLLENPFYGSRKPKEQWRSSLLHVSDLFIMGGCLIVEALVLLHWLKNYGFGPFGLTGISMGGHMASLAATNWPYPIALIPCMSWTSASVVWTEGVLSKAIPWRVLETQYSKEPLYEKEIMKLLNLVDSYKFGKEFVSDNTTSGKTLSNAVFNFTATEKFHRKQSKKYAEEQRRTETLRFMRGVMDEITHLGNYSTPVDPSLVTFVVAKDDAYFPQSSLEHMQEIWPGCEVREINSGHIAGCLIHHNVFILAIVDTFKKLLNSDYYKSQEVKSSASTNKFSSPITNSSKDLKTYKANIPIFTILKSLMS